jgi:hypothetical protein
MRWRRRLTAIKLVASLPLAWFGGNIIFGILASGTWLIAVLPESVADPLLIGVLWVCRAGALIVLLMEWVFEDQAITKGKISGP